MCGFVVVVGSKVGLEQVLESAEHLAHRGPDEKAHHITDTGTIMVHQRLAIVDLHTGKQPIVSASKVALVHNGEIWNHEAIRTKLGPVFSTKSDSEAILRGYEAYGEKVLEQLDGDFAFVVVDGEKIFAARDAIGIKPMYVGRDATGGLWFGSEQKALFEHCETIEEFPPGHMFTLETGFVRWFKPAWFDESIIPTHDGSKLRDTLIASVEKRLMGDVPVGALLSGGLDSSLVSAIAARLLKAKGRRLKTFSVGFDVDSPDLIRAREVAAFIDSDHTEVVVSIEEGMKAIEHLIWLTETYDITTIRASTPMYLMSKEISRQGVKVVLSGEGADEIFGGYLYFAHAPDSVEFHKECVSRIKRLHTSDVLRADRSTMGAAVEARVPFLDPEFLKVAMDVDPKLKEIKPGVRMEKDVLRAAFVEGEWLPESVLWRQKEQFSDGVGYSWIDMLKDLGERTVDDASFSKASEIYPHNTPMTKEAFLFRGIFQDLYGHAGMVKNVSRWIPKWQDYNADPSGRANKLHTKTVVVST
tara:strand:+ start:4984 stop:6570 length:1587 start_codon:yes stop_codon:yes gene_type:complete